MQDAIGGRCRTPQDVEIIYGAALHLRASRQQGGGRSLRAGEPDHLMTRAEQFGHHSGADPAGCASDKNLHGNDLQ